MTFCRVRRRRSWGIVKFSGMDAESKAEVLCAHSQRHDAAKDSAGYADGMNRLLSANPGLLSLFPTQLEFSSYSADGLGQIAAMFAQNYRVLVHPEAIGTLGRYTSWLTETATNTPEPRGNPHRHRR